MVDEAHFAPAHARALTIAEPGAVHPIDQTRPPSAFPTGRRYAAASTCPPPTGPPKRSPGRDKARPRHRSIRESRDRPA